MNFDYINVNQICSLTCQTIRRNHNYDYRNGQEKKGFLKKKKVEGFYDYSDELCTIQEIERDGRLFCKGKKVFRKPFIEIRMSNDRTHDKIFDTNEEMFEFIYKSPLSSIKWIDLKKIIESREVLLEKYKGYPDEYRILSKKTLNTQY